MHTFTGKATIFNHNQDLSGDVYVKDMRTGNEVRVPGRDILDFVASYVSGERISRLEQAETAEILGVERIPEE